MTPEETLSKAVSQGYKTDFDGPGAKTPEQFLEDGEKIAGVQSKKNKELTEQIEELRKTNTETNQNLKEFMDQHHKVTSEASKRGYEKAMQELKEKKFEAASEADVGKVKEIEKKEDELRGAIAKEPIKPVKTKLTPHFQEWIKDNKWYQEDEELQIEANILDSLAGGSNNPSLRTAKYLKVIEKKIKAKYPDKFNNVPNKLDTSDNTNVNTAGKKDYSNLPPEAKKICDMFVKTQNITKEEYCNNFDWSSI